jgi:hypothetical protein
MSDDLVCIIGAGVAALGAIDVLKRRGIAFDRLAETDREGGRRPVTR